MLPVWSWGLVSCQAACSSCTVLQCAARLVQCHPAAFSTQANTTPAVQHTCASHHACSNDSLSQAAVSCSHTHSNRCWPEIRAGVPSQHRAYSSSSANPSRLPPPPRLANRRVVVSGMGLVTPLGVGVEATWRALIAGQSGVRALQEEDLPVSHRPLLAQLPSRVAALVPRTQLQAALDRLQEDPRRLAPFMQYALLAAQEALQDAAWDPQALGDAAQDATGVSMGCGMSSCAEVADAWDLLAEGKLRRISPFFVPRILPNMAAGAVGIRWGLRGPNHAVSTACATGVHAIGDAYRMVQQGDADVMVAGAAESCVDALSLAGFSRLKGLSTRYNDNPAQASRPFNAGRDGFVMGEGAGAVVLECAEHAAARGARVYAEIRGYGLSGDGHHITQPHPEGRGAKACMRAALRSAGLGPGHVAYINAHATSTPQGDEAETAAIAHVFHSRPGLSLPPPPPGGFLTPTASGEGRAWLGGEEPQVAWPAVSSTKGATGHLLGAAGAVELIFTVLALHHRLAPPTVNLSHPQPVILPALVGPVAMPLPPAPTALAAMCNSFGFGGTNACLVVTTPQ